MARYVSLTDVCDFQGGSQPPKEEWSTDAKPNYIRMLQIRDFTQAEKSNIEYVKITTSIKTCNSDDILLGRYGASVGKVLTGLSGAYNVAIIKSIPDESFLDKRFLYYYFCSPHFQDYILSVGSRAAQAGFNKDDLSRATIPLFSIKEQHKICSTMDKVSDLIALRKQQLAKLDELVKARFVEMFGDANSNSKGWKSLPLGKLCTIIRGSSPRPIEDYLGGNIPWIKIGDATESESIYLTSTKQHIVREGVSKSRMVKAGSLIFANCGVSLGFARIITFDGCIHDGWLALEDINACLDKVFLLQSLNQMTKHFQEIAPAGTQPNLNTGIMKAYIQIIPPIELQRKYIDFVEQVEQSKATVQQGLDKLETLKKALMQEYFGCES